MSKFNKVEPLEIGEFRAAWLDEQLLNICAAFRYEHALALLDWLLKVTGRDYVLVPRSTVNDLLSVKPANCRPAKVREALYELASVAAAPDGRGT